MTSETPTRPAGENPRIDGATRAMAHALCDGPDGEDWLTALRLAPRALEEIEERGYVMISRSLLDELEAQAAEDDPGGSKAVARASGRGGDVPDRPTPPDDRAVMLDLLRRMRDWCLDGDEPDAPDGTPRLLEVVNDVLDAAGGAVAVPEDRPATEEAVMLRRLIEHCTLWHGSCCPCDDETCVRFEAEEIA